MSIRLKLLAAGMLGMAMSSMASAATVFFQKDFGPFATDFTTPTYQLNGFDSTLGTLTGVLIEYSFTDAMTGTVKNNAATAQTFKVTENSKATFNFSNSITSAYSVTATSGQQTFSNVAAGATVGFGPFSDTKAGSANIATLANFVDNPTNFSVATVTSTQILGGGGNIATSITTQGSGFARITYTYDAPVPEPATWTMMIGGFGMIGMAARRRRAQATSLS